MSKSYFSKLKKSTRITVISCGAFVGITMIILIFFVLNPITPSEKVIAGFGRENISRNNKTTDITTTAVTTTALEDVVVTKVSTTTTAPTTTHTDFTITVTSGSGFYVDNVIPTGASPYEAGFAPTTTETTAAEVYDDGSGYYDDGSNYNYDYNYDYGYDNGYYGY